jgi:hypothetical protein
LPPGKSGCNFVERPSHKYLYRFSETAGCDRHHNRGLQDAKPRATAEKRLQAIRKLGIVSKKLNAPYKSAIKGVAENQESKGDKG